MFHQITLFLGISGLGWVLDFTIFSILGLILEELFYASVLSALAGASFVFFLSPKFIFQDNSNISLKYRYVLYIFYQILLILFISYLIVEIDRFLHNLIYSQLPAISPFSYIISKILVTPVAMTSNFIVLKIIIERLTMNKQTTTCATKSDSYSKYKFSINIRTVIPVIHFVLCLIYSRNLFISDQSEMKISIAREGAWISDDEETMMIRIISYLVCALIIWYVLLQTQYEDVFHLLQRNQFVYFCQFSLLV